MKKLDGPNPLNRFIIFIVERYEWYSGGSSISLFRCKEDALSFAKSGMLKKDKWKNTIESPIIGKFICAWQSQNISETIMITSSEI